jgi:integrase
MATIRKRRWTSGGKEKAAWVADYFDQQRKRHTKTFKRKSEAEGWLAETQVEVKADLHTPNYDGVTIFEAAERLFDRKKLDGCRLSTLASYRLRVDKHIHRRAIGQVKLSQLTAAMGQTFYDEIASEISLATADKMLGILKEIVSFAMSRGLVRKNVLDSIARKRRTTKKMRVGRDVPSKEDINLLIASAPRGWFRDMLVVAALTGMRQGELCGLHWEDVDFENKFITVCHSADRWRNIGLPKTSAGERQIPMAPVVLNILWQRAYPPAANGPNVIDPTEAKPSGLVFVTERRPHNVPVGTVVWRTFQELQAEIKMLANPKRSAGAYGDGLVDRRSQNARGALPIIRELQASGTSSPGLIAKELNARGVATQLGGRWYRRSVIELLRYEGGKLPKYSFHALRHFAASLFIEQGFSAKRLQGIMGHSSIQMTYDRYGHLFPSLEDDHKKFAAAEAALFATGRDEA